MIIFIFTTKNKNPFILYFIYLFLPEPGFLQPPFIVFLRVFVRFFLVVVRKKENIENGLYLSHLLQEDIIMYILT